MICQPEDLQNSVGTIVRGKMSELRYVAGHVLYDEPDSGGLHNWSLYGCDPIRSRCGGDAEIGVTGLCERDFYREWIAADDAPCNNHHVLDHSLLRQVLIIPQGWE